MIALGFVDLHSSRQAAALSGMGILQASDKPGQSAIFSHPSRALGRLR
jgi:hypothetical protein